MVQTKAPSRPEEEPGGLARYLGAAFSYGGREWQIPEAYLSEEALTFDICRMEDAGAVQDFETSYWMFEGRMVPRYLEHRIETANPLRFETGFALTIGGREAPLESSRTDYWEPWQREKPSAWAGDFVERYELDPGAVWAITRVRFAWPSGKPEPLRDLALTLSAQAESLAFDLQFATPVGGGGISIPFEHPATHKVHTLVIDRCQAECCASANPAGWEFPAHYAALRYHVDPPLPEGDTLSIYDSEPGDRPRRRADAPQEEDEALRAYDARIGIISPETAGGRVTASSLYFAPPQGIGWYVDLKEIPCPPEIFSL